MEKLQKSERLAFEHVEISDVRSAASSNNWQKIQQWHPNNIKTAVQDYIQKLPKGYTEAMADLQKPPKDGCGLLENPMVESWNRFITKSCESDAPRMLDNPTWVAFLSTVYRHGEPDFVNYVKILLQLSTPEDRVAILKALDKKNERLVENFMDIPGMEHLTES